MALTVTVTGSRATAAPATFCCSHYHHPLNSTRMKLMGSSDFFLRNPIPPSITVTSPKGCFSIRASNPQREEESSNFVSDTTNNGLSQEDLSFVFKLGAGSVAGAAIIKYGSVIFPEITIPNIFLALFMIFSPVILAVALLFKQSRLE